MNSPMAYDDILFLLFVHLLGCYQIKHQIKRERVPVDKHKPSKLAKKSSGSNQPAATKWQAPTKSTTTTHTTLPSLFTVVCRALFSCAVVLKHPSCPILLILLILSRLR
jgi:hypothetical protein